MSARHAEVTFHAKQHMTHPGGWRQALPRGSATVAALSLSSPHGKRRDGVGGAAAGRGARKGCHPRPPRHPPASQKGGFLGDPARPARLAHPRDGLPAAQVGGREAVTLRPSSGWLQASFWASRSGNFFGWSREDSWYSVCVLMTTWEER